MRSYLCALTVYLGDCGFCGHLGGPGSSSVKTERRYSQQTFLGSPALPETRLCRGVKRPLLGMAGGVALLTERAVVMRKLCAQGRRKGLTHLKCRADWRILSLPFS